jgi:hypothetical protein
MRNECLNVQCSMFNDQCSRERPVSGDIEHWALDIGHWALDIGHWALDIGHWALDIGHWTLDIAFCGPSKITASALAALTACLLLAPLAAAQSKQPSNDAELRKRLDANPIDEYDRELLGGGQAKPGSKQADDMPGELEKKLHRELGAAAKKEDDHPLLDVARLMREVQKQLGKQDSDKATQEMQQRIAADLARMIDKARKSGQCPPGGKQDTGAKTPLGKNDSPPKPGSPNKPGATPGHPTSVSKDPREGKGGKVDLTEARKSIEALWPQLPARDRQLLQQLSDEDFLPEYQGLIEDYFRRLSEEKPSKPGERK